MATVLDIEFDLDEEPIIDAELKNSAGNAVNLTGFTGDKVQWGIAQVEKGPRLATVEISDGITISDAVAGKVRIKLPIAKQAALLPGDYYHACRLDDAAEGVSIQFKGRARINPSPFATEGA